MQYSNEIANDLSVILFKASVLIRYPAALLDSYKIVFDLAS